MFTLRKEIITLLEPSARPVAVEHVSGIHYRTNANTCESTSDTGRLEKPTGHDQITIEFRLHRVEFISAILRPQQSCTDDGSIYPTHGHPPKRPEFSTSSLKSR
jgi:hypothetical protein